MKVITAEKAIEVFQTMAPSTAHFIHSHMQDQTFPFSTFPPATNGGGWRDG